MKWVERIGIMEPKIYKTVSTNDLIAYIHFLKIELLEHQGSIISTNKPGIDQFT